MFREVQQRIAFIGRGKADVAMLSFWKRLRAERNPLPRVVKKFRGVIGFFLVLLPVSETVFKSRVPGALQAPAL